MNVTCSAEPCPVILDCSCVFYSGANLIYTGINTNDNLCTVITKINNKFKDAGLGYVFENGIVQTAPGQPVKLGGTLTQNTIITSGSYLLKLTGNIEASSFITTGGTSSQFVKGDGSLDSTSYQPSGSYITALTGDGTASGPGSATFTLSNSGVIANTYGSSSQVPVFAVDAKGRITSVTNTAISYPAQLLLFSGDVTGAGLTGANVTLTLNTVNSGVYPGITPLKFSVNGKGLVTGASPLTNLDLDAIYGYTPVPTTRTLTINGVTYNLAANRSWTIPTGGTVSSVSVTAGVGISASVTNPTTTPNITITNTAPDQTVVLTGGTGISTSGTYPNFTITNSAPDQTVALSSGTGISVTGTYPNFTISNTGVTSVPNLQQVTDVNNTTSNSIAIGTALQIIQQFSPFNVGQIALNNLTNSRNYELPDDAGTFALSVNGVYADGTGAVTIPVGTGTVTGVTATAPLTSSGGTTPDISTSMNTNKLIGRSTAGVGVMEEITVGTGLSLSGGTLSASSTGGILHGTASGTDTYTVTITGPTSYADGDAYLIRFTNGNTTGATLNINGLGAVTLYRNNDGPLLGGDIANGGEMLCIYNSSVPSFQCIGISPNSLIAYVTNDDSVTITKGQPVYAFSGTGDRMTVKRANNTADSTSAQTIGLVLSSSIAANQKGFIMMQGLLDGLSILPTATWSDGDPVYLGSTAGAITPTKPYAPNHLVYLGFVTTASNGSAGRLYVRVQNGYELDELHNVQAQSPTYKDTLWYDNTVSPAQWKTASISTILGYTPVNPTRSINTTSPLSGGGDLSADRTLSISQATTSTDGYLSSTDWNTFNSKFTLPSLTSGSVLFSNGTTIAQDNANFFWDDTNNRLGVGTNIPAYKLDINGITKTLTGLVVGVEQGGYVGSGNHKMQIVATGTATPLMLTGGSGSVEVWKDTTPTKASAFGMAVPGLAITDDFIFSAYTGTGWFERMRIFNGGNVAIGTSTDAGFKLDVNGTARFVGQLTLPNGFWSSTVVCHNNQLLCLSGLSQNTPYTYRNTNSTGNITPQLLCGGNPGSGVGFKQIAFDSSNNLSFLAVNSGNILISRATIGITNLVDTAGSESGDLNFSTQSGGTFRSEKMRIFAAGNVAIGTTTDAGYKLDVNGTGRFQNTLYTSSNFVSANQIKNGTSASQSVYRTTNGGSNLTPNAFFGYAESGSVGFNSIAIDYTANNGLLFISPNGTNRIARAGINITNLTNTAGSESGDMIFLTQSGGTAMSEKMRITSVGAIAFNGAANTGTSGQVLTSAGSGAPPTWQTPSGGGGVTAGDAIAYAIALG